MIKRLQVFDSHVKDSQVLRPRQVAALMTVRSQAAKPQAARRPGGQAARWATGPPVQPFRVPPDERPC
jgi:hypothetical protein